MPASRASHFAVPHTLELPELITLVRDVAAEETWWRPLVRFDAGGRWWTLLHGDRTVDVWLLSWLTDQATELHDHGQSAAAFTAVEGALQELRVAPSGEVSVSALPSGHTRWVAPGVVHDVRNSMTEPAVSVHAYSPPLTTMTYYRSTRRGLRAGRTVCTTEPEQAVGQ